MKNSFLKILLLVGIVSQQSISAASGTRDGGGGIGVTCRSGTSFNVQILDFYESENLRHLQPLPTRSNVTLEILERLKRIALLNSNPIDGSWKPSEQVAVHIVNNFLKQAQFTNETLALTDDATKPLLLPHCQFVQIAVYAPNNKIWVNSSLWNKLDIRSQAGLILHEFFYHSRREAGEKTSDSARKYIGDLFSVSKMQAKYFDMPKTDINWCVTEGAASDKNVISFYVYYSFLERRYIANFNQLGPAGIMWWRTTASIGPISPFRNNYGNFSIVSQITSELDPNKYNIHFSKQDKDSKMMIQLFDVVSKKSIVKSITCR